MRAGLSLVVALPLLISASAGAQCRPSDSGLPRPVARSITGVVTDTTGEPLREIAIVVAKPHRQVRTNARGEFRLENLDAGPYSVVVRRIGYEPASADIQLPDSGMSVRICMSVETVGLPPMVVSTFRGGLTGVVADTAQQRLAGVQIHVVGAGSGATSDSAGQFFVDLHQGEYALTTSKKGFASQVVGVSIPADSGRHVAIWLAVADGWEKRRGWDVDSMMWRSVAERSTRYKLITQQWLAETSMSLDQAVMAKGVGKANEECMVQLGGEGTGFQVPLWSLDKSEIEVMEVLAPSPFKARGQHSIMGFKMRGSPNSKVVPPAGCEVVLVAWLRK